MTEKCAPTISASRPGGERVRTGMRPAALLAFLLVTACGAEPSAATTDAPAAVASVSRPQVPARSEPAAGAGVLKLAGFAGAEATAAALAEAKRQGITEVEVSRDQSFRVMDGAHEAATLITGEGDMPDAVNAGCFVAIARAGNVELIPTIGYGDYEAETCGGPVAVGLLSSGPVARVGVIFKASSPNTELTEPLVIDWDRSNDTLLINEALSRRALDGGATSIAAMRRLVE